MEPGWGCWGAGRIPLIAELLHDAAAPGPGGDPAEEVTPGHRTGQLGFPRRDC